MSCAAVDQADSASAVLQEEAAWLLRVEAKRAMAKMSHQLNDAAAPHHKTHALKSVFVHHGDADSAPSEDAPLRFSAALQPPADRLSSIKVHLDLPRSSPSTHSIASLVVLPALQRWANRLAQARAALAAAGEQTSLVGLRDAVAGVARMLEDAADAGASRAPPRWPPQQAASLTALLSPPPPPEARVVLSTAGSPLALFVSVFMLHQDDAAERRADSVAEVAQAWHASASLDALTGRRCSLRAALGECRRLLSKLEAVSSLVQHPNIHE